MPKSAANWVVETSSTTGTGAYALSGSPPPGTSYFTFRQRFATGNDKVSFWVVNANRTAWEKNRFGTLTYGSPDTLSRNVVESTNGDAPVSWVGGDGPLRLYCVPDADAEEFAISMGLGASRPDVLKFGLWADEDGVDPDVDQINLFDGTNDIPIAKVYRTNHTIELACMPAGAIMPFAGASAPAGFLLCQGQAVSRTTYGRLLDVIGTTYGSGDGTTTFNVPDLGGRVVAGREASATRLTTGVSGIDGDTLGAAGGDQNSQNHTHTITDPGHTHNMLTRTDVATTGASGAYASSASNLGQTTQSGTTGITGTNGFGAGGSQNVQPTLVLNYMISTGGVT